MNVLKDIVKWNQERRLEDFDAPSEFTMLLEELNEFYTAYAEKDENEMADALCDIMVIAVGALYKLGYDPESALKETVAEISSRKGTFNEDTGKWEKDKNQAPETLYKANYAFAKR